MDQIGGPAAVSWSALNGQKMAMRQPGPPEVSRPCRRPWIQIPILLLMKVFYNGPKRGKIGHVKIGIGLRISGRTFTRMACFRQEGSTGARRKVIARGRLLADRRVVRAGAAAEGSRIQGPSLLA
jgi:hypothetical protein